MPPPNDAIANAILVDTDPTTLTSQTLSGATFTAQEGAAGYSFPSMWYRLEWPFNARLEYGGANTNDMYYIELRNITTDPPSDFNDTTYGGSNLQDDNDNTTITGVYPGGTVKYLWVTDGDFNGSDNLVFDMTFDWTLVGPAPPNDNLDDAILIDQFGVTSLSVTNVDASAEAQEALDYGDLPSVWYRIETDANATFRFRVTNPTYEWLVEFWEPANDPPTWNDIQGGGGDFLGNWQNGEEDEWFDVSAGPSGITYLYVYNTTSDYTEMGTFDLEVFIPAVYELDAEDYANLSSSTVSLQGGSPQWVRDDQYREYDFVNFDSMKGPFEYTHSLIIPAGTIPAGRFRCELYTKFGNYASALFNESVITQIRQGPDDMPLNPAFGSGLGGLITNGVQLYRAIADESGGYPSFPPTGTSFGGPTFVDTSKDIYICWGQTSEEESSPGVPHRYMEVQKVKFTSVPNGPPPSRRWIAMKHGLEPWGRIVLGQTRCTEKLDGSGFYVSYQAFHNVSPSAFARFTLWEYSLDGDAIELVDPRGLGDTGISENYSGPSSFTNHWWDQCITDNGDIYVISFERTTLTKHWLWLKKWDGSSWTTITSDLGGAGEGNDHWRYSCSIDTDGTDVWVAWGEVKEAGQSYGFPPSQWGWRCMKYDVGSDTFTELGTALGAGISAFQSNYNGSISTVAGKGENPIKMRVSPGGVPWVAWNEHEVGSLTNPTKNDLPYLYYWDGAAWQDADLHNQIPSAPTATGHTYSNTPATGNNYSRTVDDNVDSIDITFVHSDGPSEYPAVLFQFAWGDQSSNFDWMEFIYMEYDGASWGNVIRMPSLSQWPELEPLVDPPGDLYGQHWQDGFQMDDDGQTNYLFAQMGRSGGTLIAVVAAKLVGDHFESLGGDEYASYQDAAIAGWVNFVDYPLNPGPLQDGGNWVDNSEAGLIVGGRPVGVFHWWNGWLNAGLGCTIWVEAGGVVSMNWRSSDRRGSANRVLVGNR